MSAPNGEEMSREELLESLRAAEMQRDMVDDLIRKQQDLIKLMEQKMDKLSEVVPAEQEGDAAEASKPVADQSKTWYRELCKMVLRSLECLMPSM